MWEAALWIDDLSAEPDPMGALVEESALTRAQVDAVLHYRRAYPEEIGARIELHRRETATASPS